MAYLLISDFKGGLDRRRPRVAGVPGSLWTIRNAIISRGGDIEKSKRFVPVFNLPAGTHGLAQIGQQLFVFGSADLTVPPGLRYQRLQSPDAESMVRVLDVKAFNGKPYVVAEFSAGSVFHFYNGVRVTDWDAISAANGTTTALVGQAAERLNGETGVRVTAQDNQLVLRAVTPGVPFTVSTAGSTIAVATETLQPNVLEVDNVDAIGEITLTGGTADADQINRIDQIVVGGAVDLLATPVAVGASLTATANAVAIAINNQSSIHGFSAYAEDETVFVQAPPLSGDTRNGETLTVLTAGDATADTQGFADGVDPVAPAAQVVRLTLTGAVTPASTFVVTLNGQVHRFSIRASGTATSVFVHKLRVYAVVQSLVYYSSLNSATDWSNANTSTGAGFLNISNEASNVGRLQAMARYNNLAAVFGRETIFTYQLSTDALENASEQPLDNTGTIAPQSIVAYGSSDVFYLDETGIRSLRAREATNAAFVSDVGTVIDPFVQDLRKNVTQDVVQRAQAVVEPIDGRYWLSIGGTILVLSNFPASRITAWSALAPDFVPTAFVRSRREVYARSEDAIYLYGGFNGDALVEADRTLIETPFMDGGTPATIKQITGFDIACRGTWHLEMLVDPNDETKVIDLGRVVDATMHKEAIGVDARTSTFAIRATCISDGEASISQMAVHYTPNKAA